MTLRHPLSLLLAACLCLPCTTKAEKLEAEKASYTDCQVKTDSKYSGGKALELTQEDAKIVFHFSAAERGKYAVFVGYDAPYGDKVGNLCVGGTTTSFQMKGHAEAAVGTWIMSEGANTITVTPDWTWFRIDYIRIEKHTDDLQFDISPMPADAQATASAKELYTFLYDNFGKKTLSGIMTGDMASANGNVTLQADVAAVYQASGRHPALVGFDFMNATGRDQADNWNRQYTRAAINLAKDTWRRGGIPAFTWHWRDPSRKTADFYTSGSKARISDALNADGTWNTASPLYKRFVQDIHTVADFFLELQKAGMACIFRPLHEASGGWFWWGCEGAEPFVRLYQLIFHEMVERKGVHNVIWVWNADADDSEWNPGNDAYDIVSADIYNPDFDYSSCYVTFDNLKTLTQGKKIIALSENGPIPDVDKEFEEDAVWSWWMPWYQTWGGNFVSKTSTAEWAKCMTDSRIITLEDCADGWGNSNAIRPIRPISDGNPQIYDLQGRRLASPPDTGICIQQRRAVAVH